MGRNDISRMVNFLFFRALPLIILAFFVASPAKAQNEAVSGIKEDGSETLLYKLQHKFRLNYYYLYSYHEQTTVTRTYSDKSVKNYNLDFKLFMSINPEDVDNNDTQIVTFTMDSLHFVFWEATDSVKFNSQSEGVPPLSFDPYFRVSLPLGKDVDVTLNPYFEYSKMESLQIDDAIEWITDKERGIKDSLKLYMWLRELSFDRIKYLTDLTKSSLPEFRVGVDSTWQKNLELMADGIRFESKPTYKLVDFDLKQYTIVADSIAFQPVYEKIKVYDINHLVDITSGAGFGKFSYTLSTQGTLQRAEAELNAVLDLKFRREAFKQIIETKATWDLFKMYRY